MFVYTLIERFFPHGFAAGYLEKYAQPIMRFTNQLVDQKNQSYTFADAYLSAVAIKRAMQLKAYTPKNSNKIVLNMVDYEMSITDEFHGATFSWMLSNTNEIGKPREDDNHRRALTLKFHKKYRDFVTDVYLDHVMQKGKEVLGKNQQRKLYTNNSRDDCYKEEMWSHVMFNHPATFDSLYLKAINQTKSILGYCHIYGFF
ncbi:hypothetical protein MKW98_000281 [Papaver atlanticum]|uniref:AAA-type ATPase N-terminal domain-containing protein n=1 Tax=Papaver atlanticum TaxID=357466 RepID=A0AAD4X5W3_9MAGN|nr:hypothetical protein MKW98_000281 [Papaver atlanticum]